MTGHALPLTGERTLPGIDHERYWFARHLAAYRLAATRAGAAGVLDAGCGEGYGTALLAERAAWALGVDRAPEVIAHAASAYPGARFGAGDVHALPLACETVDVTVCLQVIEHLTDCSHALDEIARVLRPGGILVCSTPNRLTFTPGDAPPINPFHVTEFSMADLRTAIAPRFTVQALLGLRHGPRLAELEERAGRTLPELQLEAPPQEWPPWLAETVLSVEPEDFVIEPEREGDSLDLLAIAVRR